jgi:anti-sigma-K factor RskA
MTEPHRPTDLTCDDVRDLAGSFVLGALPAAEADAVRAHLATCPEAHAEVSELGSVLPVLDLDASAAGFEPSAGLKGRILAAAAAERAGGAVIGQPAGSTAEPVAFPTADQRAGSASARHGTSTGAWILRIAAVLAIVALTGWNVLLQGQVGDSQRYEHDVAEVLQAARQPGSVAAIMSPDGGTGSGIAAVTSAGVLSMTMHDLAPTSGAQVYEAWVIAADGVPVPLGSFTVGRAGTAFFEGDGLPTGGGIVLALTLEPGPGAATPTEPIVSKGTAALAG